MTLTDLKTQWQDTPEYHKHIHELFVELVNKDETLKSHRDYVDAHIFGMGERSFHYLWKILLAELPDMPKLLEIGVFKGQILSLWKLLRPDVQVFGVTPLDGRGTGWTEDDYAKHIEDIHNDFGLEMPLLNIGSSHDELIVELTWDEAPYDVIYVDGDHSVAGALADLNNYAPMVKQGGFLVVDDCCCDMNEPWGYFQGIADVQQAFDEYMAEHGSEWEFVFNVVHLRVMRRL